ncbi:MAG: L,D-transpeptidase [Sphingomonadales bacterium]|nr:MAG: L,D-transpeptidase [Sphingomonadales bacterium]
MPLPAPVAPQAAPLTPPAVPAPTRTVTDILENGVLIVVSLPSQQMHVFRDGTLWRSSPVSTGKRRKKTPTGVFAILQKKRFHRSNLYSNAPMPFMQRLTWDGIAIHAGRLPGYPASHGCIRIPAAFAAELFKVTSPTKTAVMVVDQPLAKGEAALALAQTSAAKVPINPDLLRRESAALARAPAKPVERLPASRTIAAPRTAANPASPAPMPAQARETIQLAATRSAGDASARWAALVGRRPELRAMQVAVIPAVVNGTQYYRLRASAPDAHSTCKALKRAGIECFPVS